MGKRRDVSNYTYMQARKSVLQESDVCIVCGHGGSDAADHVVPVSRGGDPYDRANLAPIHGVKGCLICLRKCNNEKSNKLITEMDRITNSRDWYA
jgi:5-methylcytosine-specific restriction endonuclease McrA